MSNSDVEEVAMDSTASWMPVPVKALKEESEGAIASGPVPNGPMMPNGSSYGGAGGYKFQSQATDINSPLSHMNESVASFDPLAAMEKSLDHHEQFEGLPEFAKGVAKPRLAVEAELHECQTQLEKSTIVDYEFEFVLEFFKGMKAYHNQLEEARRVREAELDRYLDCLFTNTSNSDVEVTIDSTASWKPVPVKALKEESEGAAIHKFEAKLNQYLAYLSTNMSNSDVEEVPMDSTASWMPVPVKALKEESEGD